MTDPHLDARDQAELHALLSTWWGEAGREQRFGCPPEAFARYVTQHLEASLPYLRRLSS